MLATKVPRFSLVGPKDWVSFKNVETYLQQDLTFSVFEGLKGKFKGIKPRQPFVKKGATSSKKVTKKSNTAKKPVKRDKSFYKNVDVGEQVFMIKKKKKPVVDDE